MKNKLVLDIECYPNYFLVAVKGLATGKTALIDMFGETSTLGKDKSSRLHNFLLNYTTFGYNSNNYDMPMILSAMYGGLSCRELYQLSVKLINQQVRGWQVINNLDVLAEYDHFDIQEPAPAVMISLKNYGTRIGSKKLWDLPYDPHKHLTHSEVENLKKYCINDLDTTIDLYNAIEKRIDLRVQMSESYGIDLRSKSDAQIAEAVITKELGGRVFKPELSPSYKAKYSAPEYVKFVDPELNQLVDEIEHLKFDIAANGSVKMPKELANRKIKIGNTTYKLGIGGLHSQEKSISVVSDANNVLRNADFTSYYPFIIINQNLFPKHLGEKFLEIYKSIVYRRLEAKATGDKLVADSLKITINGSFGKFGSKYSKLYSPDLLLATTITGQLTLLMLIEQMELNGIPVVSANTDGLEYYCPRDKIELAEALVFDLELVTGYEMEHGEYKALHAKDVNNYVAIYDNEVKSKGIYAETTLSKGRSTPIVYTAIRKYLFDGTPMEDTIYACKDINEFVSGRTVKGGGEYKGEYLGKVVRWYYSTDSDDCLKYATNGNKVPKSDGAKPMMDLPDAIPSDLDYAWYINEAISKLNDLGVEYVK